MAYRAVRTAPGRFAAGFAVAVAVGLLFGGLLPDGGARASLGAGGAAGAAPVAAGAALSSAVEVAPAFAPEGGVTDLGALPASAPVSVVVGLASSDPASLEGAAVAASEPGLPGYRHFLTPSVATARYGAGGREVAAAERYFAAAGLSVASHSDGLLISVSGPASAMAAAFHTGFDAYRTASGRTFYDHPAPASLPAIAPWSGVYGLGDAHPLTPSAGASTQPETPASFSCGVATTLTPCDIQTAYQFNALYRSNTSGAGYRIGIVDAYAAEEPQTTLASDLAQFSTANTLPAPSVSFLYPVPTTVNLNASGVNAGWGLEEALDLEWAHAAAPNASLVMAFSPNSGSGIYFAVDALVATHAVDVLSMSWGEPDLGTFNPVINPCPSACNASSDGSYAVLLPVLELAAVEGISSFAATGDCGAADGTAGTTTNFPASTPWVTAVGGTNLTVSGTGAYVGETAYSGNASGGTGTGCSNQGGSGGGFSPFPKPAWQHGPGTRGTTRGIPDVALNAGTPVEVVEGHAFTGATGTSVATPIWAGIAALADQWSGHALGLLDPALYGLLNSSRYASAFHDIRTGNNGYPAGVGWDPVTGIGSPVVTVLVPLLNGTVVAPGSVRTFVYGAPRFGAAPLTTTFVLTARGGSGSYPIEGVIFGDGNASLATNGTVNHTYLGNGAYSARSFVVDSNGSSATSPAILVLVGGGQPLAVTLAASTTSPAVGASVTFNVTVSGGQAPYLTNLSFGDGSVAVNLSTLSTTHAFAAAGGYCAEAVVRDGAHPQDAGASARVAVAVGGATAPACGNPASPLTVTAAASPGVRDAPADYPGLFAVSGGTNAPAGLATNVSYASNDPYLSDCGCTIFRQPGNFSVSAWVNDTVNGQATATTNVTVAPPLNATFSASTLAGSVPLIVSFSAAVVGGFGASAAATRWEFGNGHSAVGARVVQTYTTAGEYLVVVHLSDAGHGNASEAFLVDAEPAGPPVLGAYGTIGPAWNISSGTNVTFAATLVGLSTQPPGVRTEWNLGNGHSAWGPVVTESYFNGTDNLAGDTLAASLTLYGAHGRQLLAVPLTLPSFFATEAGGFVPAVSALTLESDVAPSDGVTPLTVVANATAAGPGGASVSWAFGDGGTGAGLNVSYTYYGAGAYTVVATAYDTFHDVAVRSVGVSANQALGVSGGPDIDSGPAPLTVNFSVLAFGGAGPPYTYNWSFPGGNLSGVTNLTLTFAAVGHYTVALTVTDRANASVRTSWSITVGPVPVVHAWEVLVAGAAVGAVVVALVVHRRRPPERFNL